MAQNNHADLLKIKLDPNTSSNFSCQHCPVDHGSRGCTKASKKAEFDFDFNKLVPILQQRFIEIATTYEKSKLQRVNKSFNRLIKPETYGIIHELIAHANTSYPVDNTFWGVNGYTAHVHPEYEPHREQINNVIVNKKFNAVSIPDQFIMKLLNQNVSFYLTKLHIHDSKLTADEFKAVCNNGTLESIFIDNVVVEPSPKAYEIAMYTANIKKFHVNIKNFVCEKNWAKSFTQFSDKRSIRLFEFRNVSPAFNANEWDKFIRTRMISTTEKDNDSEITCRIGFDQKFFNKMTKRGLQKKLDRIFSGVFKRVPKVQFDTFTSTDRFEVVGPLREQKSNRNYFFVNCRAIDSLMKKIEEQKMEKDFVALRVLD